MLGLTVYSYIEKYKHFFLQGPNNCGEEGGHFRLDPSKLPIARNANIGITLYISRLSLGCTIQRWLCGAFLLLDFFD